MPANSVGTPPGLGILLNSPGLHSIDGYGSVFDKFVPWADKQGIRFFNQVDAKVLNRYAAHLEKNSYAQKTLLNELTTLKQCVRWLIDDGHLVGRDPIKMKLRKVESQRAYCYRPNEVAAMLEHCRQNPKLGWIGCAITGLAYTGMRIEALAGLMWSDIDLENQRITLTDESGQAGFGDERRTLKSGKSRGFPIHPDLQACLLYTSPSPRDRQKSRMPSSA